MKPIWTLTLFCICASVPSVSAQEPGEGGAERQAAKAALVEEVRDLILWHDEERTSPMLIPDGVFGRLPLADLPIPEWARISIRHWIERQQKEVSTDSAVDAPCFFPGTVAHRLTPGAKRFALEEAMAAPLAVLLVSVERTTVGIRPDLGIYQYNEVKITDILLGSGGSDRNPLTTRAFLSEGGAFEIEGSKLCSKSPWHPKAPRPGDTYLLIGSTDRFGIFNAAHYLRVEGGNVVPAKYSELKFPDEPLPLTKVWAAADRLRKAEPPVPRFLLLPNGEKPRDPADEIIPNPAKRPSGPRGLLQVDADVFCEEFQGLCDGSAHLAWRSQDDCVANCESRSYYGDKVAKCHWACGPAPEPPAWQRPRGAYGNGPRLAFLNLKDGDSLSGRLVLRGFALAFVDVATLDIFWNGRRLNLLSLKMRMPCPEACEPPLGVGRIPCGPDSGFEAEIDSAALPAGPGRLALVATSKDGWTSSLELDLTVTRLN